MKEIKERLIQSIISELGNINNLDSSTTNILRSILDKYDVFLIDQYSKIQSDLKECVKLFLNIKRIDGLSQTTLKTYTCEIGQFINSMNKPIDSITTNDIRKYLSCIQNNKQYKKTTINNKITVIRSFFDTMLAENIIQSDPSARIKNLKVNISSLRNALTAEELEKLRDVCKTRKEQCFIELLYSTGCRISEIVEAKPSKINWQERSLVVHGKGDKYRKILFSVKCKLYLKEYFKDRKGDADGMFLGDHYPHEPMTKSGLEKLMNRISSRIDTNERISCHRLRHTIASDLLSRSGNIAVVSKLLGHANIKTTSVYIHTSDEEIKSVYNKVI